MLVKKKNCLILFYHEYVYCTCIHVYTTVTPMARGGATLCTRHVYSKYIIDNRKFTIQFENGLWSENISLKKILKLNVNLSSCLNLFSIWDLLNCMIEILVNNTCIKKVYKYCYSLPPKVELYWLWLFFCSVMEF